MFIISTFRYYPFPLLSRLSALHVSHRTSGTTRIMLEPPSGPSATVSSTPPQSSATSAGRGGPAVTTTAYQIPLSKVNRTKMAKNKGPASTCRLQKIRVLARRDNRTATSGVLKMNHITRQNHQLLPLVDGDIRLTLKMLLCPAPQKGVRRRKRRRIGGQELRTHTPFQRNRVRSESQRRRRRAGPRQPVTLHGIQRRIFLRLRKVVCMARPRRKKKIRPKRGKRGMMYLSTSFRTDSFRWMSCNIIVKPFLNKRSFVPSGSVISPCIEYWLCRFNCYVQGP
jgi:hypothetical protein